MKIPSEIRIGGVDYAISFADCLVSGNKALDAEIDYCNATIQIVNKGNGHQHQCIGLWHEVLHGIANHANLDIGENTEDIIEILSRGVYQVLQDNGRQLFDIVPAVTSTDEVLEYCRDCARQIEALENMPLDLIDAELRRRATEASQGQENERPAHAGYAGTVLFKDGFKGIGKYVQYCLKCANAVVGTLCEDCNIFVGGFPKNFIAKDCEKVAAYECQTLSSKPLKCDHRDDNGNPIFWNEGNKAFQCHKCGQVFEPKAQEESK